MRTIKMLANMSYRYINLARNYGLLDDEHIEKWAYGHMERDSEPEWWFSELISAKPLESVETVLMKAALESERDKTFDRIPNFVSVNSWFAFLAYIQNQKSLTEVSDIVLDHVNHDDSQEAPVLLNVLENLVNCSDISVNELFKESQLVFYKTWVVTFFKELEVDANEWLYFKAPNG
jgi:hypothetical protein